MNAFFGRTGAADFPDHLKVLITGEPKSGKTSFLGTVPNIVIADTEPHANNLMSVAHLNLPFKTISSSQDLDNLAMILGDASLRKQAAQSLGMDDIEAVASDTLDTLQGLLKKERMKEQRQSKFLRDDWGWLKEEMTAIVAKFTALPLHVFFIVHSKTKDIGSEEEAKTVILPGLEGAISESIAGMVGYSLFSFRRQILLPDGTPKTSYFLRAEGDETYGFVGNRAAGRLPDIIEPDFNTLLGYATAGRKAVAAPAPVTEFAITGQAPVQNPDQQAAPAAAAPAPVAAPEAPKPADDEPVNAAALSHIKRVYDAIGVAFPEAHITSTKTLGDARLLVKMWKATQEDHVQGQGTAETPEAEIRQFMTDTGWFAENGPVAVAAPAEVTPNVNGTIAEVLAYAEGDLAKVQEAYDVESAKDKPRTGLIEKLLAKGAQEPQPQAAEEPVSVQTDVQTEAPSEPVAEVTPTPETVDAAPTEEQAVETVKEVLGGEVIAQVETDEGNCEQCGKPVDDVDIARLSKTRFGRWLCVQDYIQATKTA